mmetsp:Transcript_2662/g.6249  ORF Transcript_2662/g.6249 Transcript_2662/m.6249 type:complete len:264 (-) Transcript_2662:56-847(-)
MSRRVLNDLKLGGISADLAESLLDNADLLSLGSVIINASEPVRCCSSRHVYLCLALGLLLKLTLSLLLLRVGVDLVCQVCVDTYVGRACKAVDLETNTLLAKRVLGDRVHTGVLQTGVKPCVHSRVGRSLIRLEAKSEEHVGRGQKLGISGVGSVSADELRARGTENRLGSLEGLLELAFLAHALLVLGIAGSETGTEHENGGILLRDCTLKLARHALDIRAHVTTVAAQKARTEGIHVEDVGHFATQRILKSSKAAEKLDKI